MSRRDYASLSAPTRRPAAVSVAFLSPSLGGGGAERWVVTLLKHFSQRIRAVGLITPDVHGELVEEARRYARIVAPQDAAAVLKQAAVVIAWGWENLAETLKDFKGKVIIVSHGGPELDWTRRMNAGMAAVPHAIRAAVSATAAEAFPPRAPQTAVWDRLNVQIIPNGVETDRCTPRNHRSLVRKEFKIPAGAKVALYCGRFSSEKRPGLLAEAVQHLPQDWVAVFAGKPSGISAEFLEGPRCIVLPFQESPGDLLAAADVFVLPSETEGHPLALTEAWIAGVPTVYCRWGFAEEIEAKHLGPLGVVVPIRVSGEKLAHAITLAYSMTPEHREHIRFIAWNNYTAGRMAAQWENLILHGKNH